MSHHFQKTFEKISFVLVLLAVCWLVFNLVYVYAILGGAKAHRIESAAYFLSFALCLILLSRKRKNFSEVITEKSGKDKSFLWFAVPSLIWFLLYLPYLDLPFLSDDYVFIVKYSNSPFAGAEGGFFRPLFGIVFHIMIRIFGTSPIPFHFLSLLLHLSCAVLVFKISKTILGGFTAAYFVFLIFLLNPVQPEVVVWISCLQELLWVFFLLLALYLYIEKKEITLKRISLVALFIVLSLLFKETAVCFILIFIPADLLLYRLKRKEIFLRAYPIYLSILALYLAIRVFIFTVPSSHLPTASLYFVKSIISQPFKTFLFPWNQVYLGGVPVLKLLLSLVFVLMLSNYFLQKKKRFARHFILALAVIYAGAVPLSKMFYIAPDLQGSRYLYLASFGWGLLLTVLLHTIKKPGLIVLPVCLILVFSFGYALSRNLEPWGKAGEIINSLPLDIEDKTAPDNYYGAYILRNGAREFKIIKLLDNIKKP